MTLRRFLLRGYWAMERRLVPGLRYSQEAYAGRLADLIPQDVSWLDVGCGRRLLPTWLSEEERALKSRAKIVVGADLDLESLRESSVTPALVFAPMNALPFGAASFDVVTANMVVEHLDDPAACFREVARVLRPNGLFIFHTPNAGAFPTAIARRVPEVLKAPLARMLDGRVSKDVFPTFYRCNTSAQIRACAAACGLAVAELSLISSTALFSVVPPVALMELLWLRMLQSERHRERRSNIIAVLRKP